MTYVLREPAKSDHGPRYVAATTDSLPGGFRVTGSRSDALRFGDAYYAEAFAQRERVPNSFQPTLVEQPKRTLPVRILSTIFGLAWTLALPFIFMAVVAGVIQGLSSPPTYEDGWDR